MVRRGIRGLFAAGAVAGAVTFAGLHAGPSRHGWPRVPDANLTPGATLNVSLKELCTPGYTKTVRNVPTSEAKAVFAEYHVAYLDKSAGELDHLISLELGGSNDITNLWPQYGSRPNPKDGLEGQLHRQVCAKAITLADAQAIIVDPAQWPKK